MNQINTQLFVLPYYFENDIIIENKLDELNSLCLSDLSRFPDRSIQEVNEKCRNISQMYIDLIDSFSYENYSRKNLFVNLLSFIGYYGENPIIYIYNLYEFEDYIIKKFNKFESSYYICNYYLSNVIKNLSTPLKFDRICDLLLLVCENNSSWNLKEVIISYIYYIFAKEYKIKDDYDLLEVERFMNKFLKCIYALHHKYNVNKSKKVNIQYKYYDEINHVFVLDHQFLKMKDQQFLSLLPRFKDNTENFLNALSDIKISIKYDNEKFNQLLFNSIDKAIEIFKSDRIGYKYLPWNYKKLFFLNDSPFKKVPIDVIKIIIDYVENNTSLDKDGPNGTSSNKCLII